MAHLIEKMTRASDTEQSWHGKENVIPADAPFDAWFDASGLNWKACRSKVRFCTDRVGTIAEMPEKHVLFRSDTLAPLAVVGEDYHIFQPRSILEFFREFCTKNQLVMDTAGCLAGGRRVWALARTGAEVCIGGGDVVRQYILLATSYDTSLATIAKHTSVRVVCNNTLTIAANNSESCIRVPHSAEFNVGQAQLSLGLLAEDFDQFGVYANEMHKQHVEPSTAARWYAELLKDREVTDAEFDELMDNRVLRGLMKSYQSAPGAEATTWGLVNGATAFVDHVRGRGYETRMNAAWFGAGDKLKQQAWDKAAAVIDAAKGLVTA
jgi:phage/plasmid-like protein (TIGR03299 family)